MNAVPPHPSQQDAFTRARYTPLRDVIHGRLSGRLNIRGMIAASGLPATLAELVLHVVRRTRLSRLEKVDVAEELVAHFRDGLDAGRPIEQLKREFGDADRAAKLIRRAKLRNRTALQRLPRYTMYGLGVLALLYAIIAIRFFAGSPSPTRDFLAEFNRDALAAVQEPEQCAWPLYREALIMLEEQPKWESQTSRLPGGEEWEDQVAYLQRNAEALAIARQAASRPHMGYVAGFGITEEDAKLWPGIRIREPDDDELLIGLLLPYLADMRQLGQLLLHEARLAAIEDDSDRITENIAAVVAMSEHTRELSSIINELVGFALLALALDATLELLDRHDDVFTEANLVELAHRISAAHGGGRIVLRLESERLWFYDFLQRVYTDDGRGGGRLTAEGIEVLLQTGAVMTPPGEEKFVDVPWYGRAAMPLAGVAMANRRDMRDKYDELMAMAEQDARQPLWRHVDRVEPKVGAMSQNWQEKARYAPIVVLMPAMTKAAINGEMVTQRRDATLAVLALHLYQRRHGRWPSSLDELVPQFLPQVPVDRFDGRPLRYRLVDGSPVLYSVGSNLRDDGGVVPRDALGRPRMTEAMRWLGPERVAQRELPDGDWVLWPPVK